MTSVGVALPEDGTSFGLSFSAHRHSLNVSGGRWVAFIVCNAEFPSAPAEKAMRYAEFAMRSRGTIFFCEGEDVAQMVIALAEREQIDILIVGTPKRSTLLRRLRRDTVDRIIHAARSFDVVVVADDQRS